MSTYTRGFHLKTKKIITKNDIITMCNLLNSKNEYSNLCEFKPEGITEGGIVFNFKDNFDTNWYKSMRLRVYDVECVSSIGGRGKCALARGLMTML